MSSSSNFFPSLNCPYDNIVVITDEYAIHLLFVYSVKVNYNLNNYYVNQMCINNKLATALKL